MKYALTQEFERILGRQIPERGQNAMTRCPWHEDRSPSLSLDLERGLFICFQCGERGTIRRMADLMGQPIDESELVKRAYEAALAGPYADEPPDFADLALDLFTRAAREKPTEIVRYLSDRNLSGKVFDHFRLGWDGKRIAMPYYDEDRVVGIKYRYPTGAKTNEPGSRRYLYNVNDIRDKRYVVLCEGESDTHSLWSRLHWPTRARYDLGVGGIPGVGVGQPSRPTWELFAIELMSAEKVYIAFDADEAGDRGAETPMSLFGSRAVRIRPTRGKDMTEHLQKGGTLAELGLELDKEDSRLLVAS